MQDVGHLLLIFFNIIYVFVNHLDKILLQGKLFFEKLALFFGINISLPARLLELSIDIFEVDSLLLLQNDVLHVLLAEFILVDLLLFEGLH